MLTFPGCLLSGCKAHQCQPLNCNAFICEPILLHRAPPNLGQTAIEEARVLEDQQGVIVPVVLVDRHPMLALLLLLCEREANAVAKQARVRAQVCVSVSTCLSPFSCM